MIFKNSNIGFKHIIFNLNNSSGKLTAAESRITDFDIAEEMMNLIIFFLKQHRL